MYQFDSDAQTVREFSTRILQPAMAKASVIELDESDPVVAALRATEIQDKTMSPMEMVKARKLAE